MRWLRFQGFNKGVVMGSFAAVLAGAFALIHMAPSLGDIASSFTAAKAQKKYAEENERMWLERVKKRKED